jgi:NAD(P)H dehydrogenase (quinone)
MSAQTLLVTGAAGHLGRATLEFLLAQGSSHHLIASTRRPETLADFAAKGVEIRKADFDDAASLEAAFRGVDRLLIVSTDALDRPGHRFEQHQRAIDAAVREGVKHLIYTSVVRADEADSPLALALDHRLTEAAIARSGLDHTIIRNNWYSENLLVDVQYALTAGTIAFAAGEGKVGWVARQDCARAAAAALLSDFQGKRKLDVTGPQALSMTEIAKIVSEISGKPVAYVPVSAPVRKGILEQAGLPGFVADVLVNAEEAMAQGWLSTAPGDLESLAGAKPTSLLEFLRKAV